MGKKLDTRRFHCDTGPDALFVRVRQVFAEPVHLKTHGKHFQDRVRDLDAPVWALEPFVPGDWALVLVEARADTGKFVTSTWKRAFGTAEWWLAVGYNDTIKTFYEGNPGKKAKGSQVVTEGPVWDLVAAVNADLAARNEPAPHRE